jgi:hypothetical protein
MSQLSRQCRILNILQPYRPPQPVTGIIIIIIILQFTLDFMLCVGVHSALVRVNEELLERKVTAPV